MDLYKKKLPLQPVALLGRASCMILLTTALSSCGALSPIFSPTENNKKEYFPEDKYGVAASPRVVKGTAPIPRGGGRSHVGKPYQVQGKWYYPKEKPVATQTGLASWYGEAFQGRLTANGEVYDKNHLTAAHPTMPLPSYARVTNLENGSSIIVRVNDRGPFAKGRIIDLSKQAATLLAYNNKGTAKVRVDYMGPAPLHGNDDSYLLASYRSREQNRAYALRQKQQYAQAQLPAIGPIPQQSPLYAQYVSTKQKNILAKAQIKKSNDLAMATLAKSPEMPLHGPIPQPNPRLALRINKTKNTISSRQTLAQTSSKELIASADAHNDTLFVLPKYKPI